MRMQTKLCEAIGVLSAVSLLACGQATSVTAPSPATGASGSITAVVVTGPPSSGINFQLTASAKTADGSTQDVTALARWEASDPTKVSISSTGWVTILALGTVDIRATYRNVSGSTQVRVTPPPPDRFVLSGTVREVQPTSRPVPGATVRITAGPDIGTIAVADDKGAYTFPGLLAGFVAIETNAVGYQVNSVGFAITASGHVDLWLAPNPPKDDTGATATARCNDGAWSWAQTTAEACAANGGIAYPVCPGVLCPDGGRAKR